MYIGIKFDKYLKIDGNALNIYKLEEIKEL